MYRAVCLDLGLIVERPTHDAAADELYLCVQSYVKDAQEADLTWEQTLRPVSKNERLYVEGRALLSGFRRWMRELFALSPGGMLYQDGVSVYKICT